MPSETKHVELTYLGIPLEVQGRYIYDKDDSSFEAMDICVTDHVFLVSIQALLQDNPHAYLIEEACREKLDQQYGSAPEFPGFKRGE